MIRLKDLHLSRGGRPLLTGASTQIAPGERIALIGRNGCGKSTLLAAFAGELAPDRGEIETPPLRVATLAQQAPRSELPALAYVLQADGPYARARAALDAAEAAQDAAAQAEAHALMADADGYSAPARAARLLDGLGFAPADLDRPVDAFSGGWKMRLNLARLLMTPADLLLMDEPTNHLDLDAIVWLQDWLLRFPGTVLVVSHDREFVDAIAHATLHLAGARLRRYAGGYSAWETLSSEEASRQEKLADTQARQVAHLQSFIDRFKAKASKAKQAQSRVKALERMTRVAAAPRERDVVFRFDQVGEGPDPLLRAEDLDAGHALPDGSTRPVLHGVKVELRRGARTGVLGRNGAGKSTLIRSLVGDLAPLAGSLHRARDLRVGYFAQTAIEELRAAETPMWHLARVLPAERPQNLRDYLAGFGFQGEQATLPVGPFSGGEKSRLALALIAAAKPHLLVLDEPTNHLDADARDALALALSDFDGALLLVSHDRHLLRATVDDFVIVHDGTVEPFDGDLDDYRQWLGERTARAQQQAASEGASDAGPSRREQRAQDAASRKALAERRRPLEKRVKTLEAEMAKVQARLAELDTRLADPALYATAGDEAARLTREHGTLRGRLDELEMDWLGLQEELEAIG